MRSLRVVLCVALSIAALAVACSDGSEPPDARTPNEFDATGSGGADAAPADAPAADAAADAAPI